MKDIPKKGLDIEEVRLVSDLRVMHSKVDELYHIVMSLKSRHHETSIRQYADDKLLAENIQRVDELYLWFITLKEERRKRRGQNLEPFQK